MAANNSMKPSCFTPKGAETLAEVKKRAIEFLSSFLHEIGSLHFDLNSHVQNDSCATNEIVNDSQTSEHKVLEGQKQSHLANALVVSHGGVIRQLLLYFLEDLASEFPSGSNRKVRFVSPNTGVSKFRIFINEQTKLPEFVECICLHNAEHLSKSE